MTVDYLGAGSIAFSHYEDRELAKLHIVENVISSIMQEEMERVNEGQSSENIGAVQPHVAGGAYGRMNFCGRLS